MADKDFRQDLADTLKIDVADLGAYWDRLCKQSHESAYLDIRGALLARSFTVGQIDSWGRGAEFERDIGLYWALVRGARVHNIGGDEIERLDRRAELLTVMVELDSGAVQEPAGEPARISYGVLSTTNLSTGEDDPWTRETVL